MARIGGQELNFGAGAEGFLTKFAEGLANDPTRKALAQLRAKQAVEEEAKLSLIPELLTYVPEKQREIVQEKLTGEDSPSYTTLVTVLDGVQKQTFKLATDSETKQSNNSQMNWISLGNTGLFLGKKGTKLGLPEQKLAVKAKFTGLMDIFTNANPNYTTEEYKQYAQQITNNFSPKEKTLYEEATFGPQPEVGKYKLRTTIARNSGLIVPDGTEGFRVNTFSKDIGKFKESTVADVIDNHPIVNSKISLIYFGAMKQIPTALDTLSKVQEEEKQELSLQTDTLIEEISAAAGDTTDEQLNRVLLDQATGIEGTTVNDILNSELLQPATLEAIISKNTDTSRKPEEFTENFINLIEQGLQNSGQPSLASRPDILQEVREILRERLENIRS